MRLANGGWWSGDPRKVLEARTDDVMDALAYEDFKAKYEREIVRLNRGGSD